ncbi:hypothetical protein EAH72_31125 [Pseudomonas caspiana]|nr:hypothetical protein [Pseudomonas caspiana]TPG89832.1 hypothetical protein EAH72_31125 [Pseudomonas caspiana]
MIGLSYSQPVSVLLASLKDMKGAASFLHAIEREAFKGPGENASEPEFQDLEAQADCHVSRWGSSKDHRIERFRSALITLTERRRADMDVLFEVVEHCYQLASDHSGSVDVVFEQGGHLHPDPICAVFYELHSVILLARQPATEGLGYLKNGNSLFELIPTLISENEELKAKTETWCGYGDDDSMNTFYGDKASIRVLGDIIFELEGLRQDAKRPWWLRLLPFSSKTIVGSPAALTNTSGQAHCPHCAVCHTAEETCIQALRRILALYEGTKQGSGGVAPCA